MGDSQHSGSQPYYLAGAILSLISALVVVISYIKLPPVRKHPSGIIFYRSLLDILFSVHMIALYGVDYSLYQETYSGYCTAYAFFFQFCILSSQTLYFALVLDMSFAVLINPFGNPRSYMKYYLALTAVMGVITATIMVTKNDIVYRPGLDICWIEPTTTRGSVNGYNWGLLFGIITFYYVFAIFASIIVLLRLSQGSGKLFKTRSQTNERFVYVAVFTAYWTVAGALYAKIYVIESDITCTEFCPEYDEHSPLYRAFAFVISVRGLVDAVVWILNQRVVFYAVEAYRKMREEKSLKPAEPAFSPSSLAGPKTGYFKAKHSRKRSMSLQQQVEEDLNKTLRAELLHFATSGVCDALDLANSQTRTAIYNPDTHAEHFVDEPEQERPENLAYPRSLFQEYGFCCSSQSKDRDAAIKRIDVRFTSRGSIRHRNSHATQGAATIERGDLVFLDYAPQVFRFLRRRFGIDDNELKRSITGDDFRESGEERMTELFTEGAGGSFFYFTRDKKYIIKTLTRRESSFLLKILRPYAMYMSSYPDTFITKFLGFYSVRQTMTLEPLYFVVMQSVFWNVPPSVKIHTRYDLKGSYINRNAKGRGATSSLLLDNDLKHKLALQPDHRDKFRQQVSSDAKFLASLDVMDYSLLVGVHNSIWATNSSASRKQTSEAKSHARTDSHTPFHQSIDGGMEAAYIKGPGVYVVGIIDILQEWDFSKKLEHYFKVFIRRKDREGISAIPPRPYCERFVNSMYNVTEADELDTRELLLLQERNKGTADQRSMTTVTRLSVESRASTKDRLPGLPLPSNSIPIPAPAGSARSSVNPSPRQHQDASPETGSLRKSGMFGSPDATLADPSFAQEEAPRPPVDSPTSSSSRAQLDRDTVVIELQTSSTTEANLAI